MEIFNAIDISLFRFINSDLSNSFLDIIMPRITNIMGGYYLVFFSISMICLLRRGKKAVGFLLLAALSVEYYFVNILKGFIRRPRPFDVLKSVNVVFIKSGGFSFPSGHTTIAFLTAYILSNYFRKLKYVFYLLATTIAFSRIYLGLHYPSDVLSGAILGSGMGYIMIKGAKVSGITPEKAR